MRSLTELESLELDQLHRSAEVAAVARAMLIAPALPPPGGGRLPRPDDAAASRLAEGFGDLAGDVLRLELRARRRLAAAVAERNPSDGDVR